MLGIVLSEEWEASVAGVTSTAPYEACAITTSGRHPSGNNTTSRDFEPLEKVGCDIWSNSTLSLRDLSHSRLRMLQDRLPKHLLDEHEGPIT